MLTEMLLKNRWIILSAVVGGILGFLYWYNIGCEGGNCMISSVWYRMTGYGMLMGGLLASMVSSHRKENSQNTEKQ